MLTDVTGTAGDEDTMDCASPTHNQSGSSRKRNTNGNNGGDAIEENMQKKKKDAVVFMR
jgi:hypothetical protein